MRSSPASSIEGCAWSELPRPAWRRLLSPPQLLPGARILVIDRQPIRIANWLAGLSFDVVAACEDVDTVEEGRHEFSCVEFLRIAPGPRFTLPWHSFDAAFVEPLSAHAGSWLSLSSRLFTAVVLASLKPRGRLIWWRRGSDGRGHDKECWARHLGCFPGRLESREVAGGWFAAKAQAQSLLVTFDVPAQSLSVGDWRGCVQQGLLTDRRACCAFAESLEGASPLRHAA